MEDDIIFAAAKGIGMNSGQLLYRGIRAFKTGQMDEARRLLEQVVAQDEGNETAWLGLSSVIEDGAQRRICLENVLSLNPNNEVAKERLAQLPERRHRTTSWLWRWLTKRSNTNEQRTWSHQIQPLEPAQKPGQEKGISKNNTVDLPPFRTHFLLAGAVGIVVLTALLVVVI